MARRSFLLAGLFFAWLASLALGFFWLSTGQAAPGRSGQSPGSWPAGSDLRPRQGRFALLLFAHPHCPCTRANLDEFAWVLARAGGTVDAHVLLVVPPGAPAGWERTASFREAAALPGVTVVSDTAGKEARLFGAATSGQTLLYDPQGRLVFQGGLAPGKGHSGDNPGRRALLSCFSTPRTEVWNLPVFGCPLFDSE